MNKIVSVRNPITKEPSTLLIGDSLDTMCMVVSIPDMNRTLGWINVLHDEIINTEFSVVPTIDKDVSLVENKFHDIWTNDRENYSLNSYMMSMMVELKHEIEENFDISTEIDEMTGGTSMSLIDLTEHISGDHLMASYDTIIADKSITDMVFRFTITDSVGWETVGYCVRDANGVVTPYVSPIDFLESLEGKTYGYMGMLNIHNAITTRDVVDADALGAIVSSVETRLSDLSDVESHNTKIDSIFNV